MARRATAPPRCRRARGAAAEPVRRLEQETRLAGGVAAHRVDHAVRGGEDQLGRRRGRAARLHRQHGDLGERGNFEPGRGEHDDAREGRQLQIHGGLARGGVVVDGAGGAGADAGRHHDGDVDVSLPVGDDRPEGLLADPHRDGGAGARVKGHDRGAVEGDLRAGVHAPATRRQLDDQERDLRESVRRWQISRDEPAQPGCGARHLQHARAGERSHRLEPPGVGAGDHELDRDLLFGPEQKARPRRPQPDGDQGGGRRRRRRRRWGGRRRDSRGRRDRGNLVRFGRRRRYRHRTGHRQERDRGGDG